MPEDDKDPIWLTHKILAGAGAAYGTAKSGIGIAGVGTFRPDLIMKVRRILSGNYGTKAKYLDFAVSDPSGYGRNYRRILASDIGSDSRRFGTTSRAKLQSFQVRVSHGRETIAGM
ncbi:hypothetical protein OEA41_010050 [Lepraria neglecta]|uniref:Uncharacterized protein n=1 Tax=Lepraria neglecta TaxID=209136 RepID=A0AAD9YVU0_9LECA|nr:hypothetical protein OEA41_010050 [Lepraria neglecta]